MATACGVDTAARELLCRNGKVAAHLKLVSIGVIFFTSVFGFSSPALLARLLRRSGDPATYDKAILLIKCFAAGVILSTSLVHVMPDAFAALADCHVASSHPWKDYPFSGLGTLVGAVLALLVDLTASSHAELHNHSVEAHVSGGKGKGNYEPIGMDRSSAGSIKQEVKNSGWGEGKLRQVKEYYRVGEKENDQQREEDAEEEMRLGEAVVLGVEKVEVESEEELERRKQRMVSKVLEIGIIFHSVIIGVTMGMSQNQCTIRPLVAALAFHQIFEGMGLGGCIAQAGFGFTTTAYMCFMFAATTPLGIILGMIIFSLTGYDDTNANALILEGLLGSLSSGILIYMALVNLISADFFHNKMMGSGETSMKKTCYIALILGSASMSLLALWA